MTYNLTNEEKQWLGEAIDLMPEGQQKTAAENWLSNAGDTVTDAQLNSVLNFFNGGLYPQVQGFVSWVKGGTRPPHPH